MMNKHTVAFLFSISSLLFLPSFLHAAPAKSEASQVKTVKVNINTAQLEELILLPGIGAKKAQSIIEYRTKNGKFKSLNELTNVKGIGSKMLQKLEGRIKLN
ncbi:ComEA family DNA-binding protein [Paraglaciecola marina]|uniref:ComEA family DNA-binding protein n=1 Tax=Paraglaciecola marina TaxID=2500157 RepID=UPI001EF09333|nr:ComEA family DNA-binding protein [Paraglaciecola marina]